MSSDRSDGGEPGDAAQGAPPREAAVATPIERSSRGRVVIRSSSHPPAAEHQALDARERSGARLLPTTLTGIAHGAVSTSDERTDLRSKKATPAERPRRRRQVQAAQAERSRQDTPAARPVARKRRRGIDPLASPANDFGAGRTHADRTGPPAQSLQDANVQAAGARAPASISPYASARTAIGIAVALFVGVACWLLLRG